MSEALDDLPGNCPACGGGPVIIDTAGAGEPKFWAYCDACDHCCCQGATADEVAANWDVNG